MRQGNGQSVCVWPLIVACCTGLARAERGEAGEPEEPVRIGADVAAADVYINDNLEADDAIARARRLARAGRWTEAAKLLQQTSDTAGDRLVRISPRYYVGIREHIADIIAGWPEEGVRAYRSLFEPEMAAALEATSPGRSTDEHLALFDRYFCTAAAARLADAIGQLAIESGDLALARRVHRRVLDHHPDRAQYAQRYGALLAVVRAMGGETPPAGTDSDRRTKLRWMGEDRTVGEITGELDSSFAALREPPSPMDWPIFGGSAERNRLGTSHVDELGVLWRFRGFDRGSPPSRDGVLHGTFRGGPETSHRLGLHPVVSGSLVFVQHYREIVALHRNTGMVAWRYRADAASTSLDDLEDQPPGWDSVTVHAGRVYASLPGDVVPYFGYESAQTPPELVCLDADTGRLIWPADQEVFTERFIEVRFDSTPIVRHGRLYVVGRRRRSFGFEDCYLYRFNAADGTLDFRTHLGSASTGTFGSRRATMAIAAMHGDTVYVCTNLGTVAAVSAHTGAVRWLRLYDRDPADDRHGSSWIVRDRHPWAFNPVVWYDGRIVCLPTDSPNVLILAEDDGRVVHSIPISELGDVEMLLGVRGDKVCGVGTEAACYDLAAGTVVWSSPLPVGAGASGRGVWEGERLLVPTREGLSAFDIADGRRTDFAWDTEGTGGNLVALPDQLLVAGADAVCAYVRKAEIWRSMRERMAAAPSDPVPALELAEVAVQGGEWSEAIDVLGEAVRRAGGLMEPIEASVKRRLFDDLLMFVDVLSARSALDKDVLRTLFSYASRCPPDMTAHVTYRFRFGELFEGYDQPAEALRLYQQVLRDRTLREHVGDGSAGGCEPAGIRAQSRIAGLIERFGSAAFAPYEAEARQWLKSGQTAKDESTLRRVVETFPNSNAAPVALVALGELLVQRDRPTEAATHFSRAFHRYPREVNRPLLLRKIADAYEQAGQIEHAYSWLTKGAREYPSATVEHEGRRVSFLEYRERLGQLSPRLEPACPRINLPLDRHFVRKFEEPATLLAPWFGSQPASDWSRYFVYTAEGLRAFDTRTNDEAWTKPATVRSVPELLIATSEVAVFATGYEVFGLDAETGERRWSRGEYPPDFGDAIADWEDGNALRSHAFRGDRLVSVRDDGMMTCVAIGDGRLVWAKVHRPVPAGRIRLAPPWVVYHAMQDEGSVVCLVDAATGAWEKAIKTDEPGPVEDFFMTLDGRLAVATSRSIASYDVGRAVRRWRVALDGHLRSVSLLFDLDAVYFSDDGRRLKKLSLEDGRTLWQCEELVRRREEDLAVERQGSSLVVSTTASVAAVDMVTGLTLWHGTTPELPRFVLRALTQSYVVAVDVGGELRDTPGVAYFYDHRNASGLIPSNGGARSLGHLENVGPIVVGNGALIIQTGSTIQGWME